MTVILFAVLLVFITGIQAFLPKFLKDSDVFGVYVPDTHVKDERIGHMKRRYTQAVLATGMLLIIGLMLWSLMGNPLEEQFVFVGLGLQFLILFVSMGLYAKYHVLLTNLKREEKWGTGHREKKVIDLQFREQLKLLPNVYFVIPMLVNLGLWVYALSQYDALPNQIPTHWGLNGEADAFSEKTWLSVSALPLTVLITQGMILFFNVAMKQAGTKIQVRKKNKSRKQQLAFRKYSSWLLFLVMVTVTLLMGYLQLSIIHSNLMSSFYMMFASIAFIVIIFGAVMFYTVKVGQSGTRIDFNEPEAKPDDGIDVDDDRYWKLGLFYVNKDDPSLMVEKRFGVGWTLNFGHVGSWIFLLITIGSIVLVSTIL
jgi:uncharacterized membrane protein